MLCDRPVRKIYKLIHQCCKSILQQSGNNLCTNKRWDLQGKNPFLNFQLVHRKRSHQSRGRASISGLLFLKTNQMQSDKTRICKGLWVFLWAGCIEEARESKTFLSFFFHMWKCESKQSHVGRLTLLSRWLINHSTNGYSSYINEILSLLWQIQVLWKPFLLGIQSKLKACRTQLILEQRGVFEIAQFEKKHIAKPFKVSIFHCVNSKALDHCLQFFHCLSSSVMLSLCLMPLHFPTNLGSWSTNQKGLGSW